MDKKQKLSQSDWIRAAFRALNGGGPQAIKAESIARSLKVSKGSFYWHFKDVADLKSEMLAHWMQGATTGIIDAVTATAGGPKAQIYLLIKLATDDRADAYGGTNTESAIRDWARYDANAARVLARVDGQRLTFLTKLFAHIGTDDSLSRTKAAVLYAGLIGLKSLNYTGSVTVEKDLEFLLNELL